MKVYFDYQALLMQRYGGVSRYFFELYNRLSKIEGVHPKIHCFYNKSYYFEELFGRKYQKSFDAIRGKGILNKAYSILDIKTHQYDILHPTYYDPYIIGKGKLVITVYDMIHELFPDEFVKEDRTIENKRKLIYSADHIITISESTKRDILKFYPEISKDKISVTYLCGGVDLPNERVERSFPERYILFVGTRYKYKNYEKFLSAIKPLLISDPSLYLVVLGGEAFTEEESMWQNDVSSQIVQMNTDDGTLYYAYSHAICFVFPSLYEGFGIPTLEAFSCGCPVILSNTSSMPEVGGDAVLYVDPCNVESIRNGIERVIQNEEMRNSLAQKGKEQYKKFSWDKTAYQTLECYKKVLDTRNSG